MITNLLVINVFKISLERLYFISALADELSVRLNSIEGNLVKSVTLQVEFGDEDSPYLHDHGFPIKCHASGQNEKGEEVTSNTFWVFADTTRKKYRLYLNGQKTHSDIGPVIIAASDHIAQWIKGN